MALPLPDAACRRLPTSITDVTADRKTPAAACGQPSVGHRPVDDEACAQASASPGLWPSHLRGTRQGHPGGRVPVENPLHRSEDLLVRSPGDRIAESVIHDPPTAPRAGTRQGS